MFNIIHYHSIHDDDDDNNNNNNDDDDDDDDDYIRPQVGNVYGMWMPSLPPNARSFYDSFGVR